MNGPEHPHVNVLAAHHEALLAGDEQKAVQHHLAACADCQRVVAQLDEVSRLLTAEGRRPVTMPSAVAARLEGALTEEAANRYARDTPPYDEHRSAAVTSLTSRRASGARSAHGRVWPVLAAAAAVVVVSAVGIQVMRGDEGADVNADSAVSRDHGGQAEPDGAAAPNGDASASTQGDVAATAPAFSKSQRASVSALARNLAKGSSEVLDATGVCAAPPVESASAGAGPVSLIRWQGSPALLQVNVAQHRLVVLDCKTASRQLFATTY